ncbi:DUF6157 family protein [Actinoplanes sp. NPDC023714]|uniref:DUF6157 family protein n=1 Tax=Actinoplanes sp. NPDC023714 TaxID=3154322 RepID=UPI00340B3BE1
MHSTNYVNTFIQVAEDTTAVAATIPPERATPSVAERTFRMIAEAPYAHTSDDVVFTVWADRKGLPEEERAAAREKFFATGQPCLRASDLGKRYGWGIHCDGEGRVALVPMGSADYERLSRTGTVTRAMRSRR